MRIDLQREDGSALLVVFFVCIAAAIVLQAAWGTLLCAQRAVADEAVGRQRLAEKDDILSLLRLHALARWEPLSWMVLGSGEGMLSRVAEEDHWLLEAQARQDPSLSLGETSAWMERGRDGLDLPTAALVADTTTGDLGRDDAWVGVDETADSGGASDGLGAECFLQRRPAGLILSPGCECLDLPAAWHLDAGWTALAPREETAEAIRDSSSSAAGVAAAQGVAFLAAVTGLTQSIPVECRGDSRDAPTLIVLTGGATLDARGRGDIYAVLVVDGGSVLLDGTIVHGAAIATGTVSLGATGQVLFARDVVRWATDRSLKRARLMPGTRGEGME